MRCAVRMCDRMSCTGVARGCVLCWLCLHVDVSPPCLYSRLRLGFHIQAVQAVQAVQFLVCQQSSCRAGRALSGLQDASSGYVPQDVQPSGATDECLTMLSCHSAACWCVDCMLYAASQPCRYASSDHVHADVSSPEKGRSDINMSHYITPRVPTYTSHLQALEQQHIIGWRHVRVLYIITQIMSATITCTCISHHIYVSALHVHGWLCVPDHSDRERDA